MKKTIQLALVLLLGILLVSCNNQASKDAEPVTLPDETYMNNNKKILLFEGENDNWKISFMQYLNMKDSTNLNYAFSKIYITNKGDSLSNSFKYKLDSSEKEINDSSLY